MYLVINNFYNSGPEALMDDMDRACGWDKVSDASDKQQILELKADVDRYNEVIYQLREENAVLRDRLDGLENSGDAYTQYATTATLISNLQAGLHDALGALVASGEKIQAIKAYRAATRLGLKECKDYIDNNFPPPTPTKPTRPCRDCVNRDEPFEHEPCSICDPYGERRRFTELKHQFDPGCRSCRFYTEKWGHDPCVNCYWTPEDDEE